MRPRALDGLPLNTAVAEAFCDDLVGCWGVVHADEAAAEAGGGCEGGSAAGAAVDHGVAGVEEARMMRSRRRAFFWVGLPAGLHLMRPAAASSSRRAGG